tara:strand:- start:27515 stop:28291 length:777 start_codon:yes stop_codon:yes gene_type:complete
MLITKIFTRFTDSVSARLFNLKIYYYYTARPIGINPLYYIRKWNEYSCKITLKHKHPQLYEIINVMLAKSQSTGAEFSDYLHLYNFINRTNPKHILECGSGVTTAVIAYSIEINHQNDKSYQGHLVTMEEDPFYYEQIKSIFPDNLNKHVTFIHSERVETSYDGHLGSSYSKIPPAPYDFMFIDGPTDRKYFADLNYPKCFNADIINLISSGNETIEAFLDQRIHTLTALKKLLPHNRITYNPITKLSHIYPLSTNDI